MQIRFHHALSSLVLFAHLTLTSHAAEMFNIPKLPALHAIAQETSISGLSSGGFMAAQFHVAYSKLLMGAGIIAGGPWNCAGSKTDAVPFFNAVTTCMNPCKYTQDTCQPHMFPDATYLSQLASQKALAGEIDPTMYLLADKVYLFSGVHDKTVLSEVVNSAKTFYQALGVPPQQIHYQKDVPAGHGFITKGHATTKPCASTEPPYINGCEIALAEKILSHIYGSINPSNKLLTGTLMPFDQREFFPETATSMDHFGYLYIPESCHTVQCRIHVALHGCEQGASVVGKIYVTQTGYLEVADNNQMLLLFPQVKKSLLNPHGCWDFWGYTDFNLPPYSYYSKRAPQMITLRRMIERLISAPISNQQCVVSTGTPPFWITPKQGHHQIPQPVTEMQLHLRDWFRV